MFWRHWGLAVVGVVAVTTAVYSAREYAGGPALLPGPLALLALGYTAPRRVGWIGAAGYVAVAAVVRLALGDADLGPCWSSPDGPPPPSSPARRSPPAANGRRRSGNASCTLRSRHSPTNGCASPRICTTRWPTRWRRSTSSPASPPTSSTATPARPSRRWKRSGREQRRPRRAHGDRVGAAGVGWRPPAPTRAVATLEALGDLVTRARADGLTVDVDIHGDVSARTAVSAAAYRVVQEALTNTRRHAGAAARASRRRGQGRGALTLRVSDDGGGHGDRSVGAGRRGGFGLVGMRERVESTGGTLDVRRDPEGFEVRAVWGDRP